VGKKREPPTLETESERVISSEDGKKARRKVSRQAIHFGRSEQVGVGENAETMLKTLRENWSL